MIDRTVYFNSVRESLFGGAMEQIHIDGQSVILSVWEYQAGGTPMTDLRQLAYMLATTFHETAYRMWPIEEYGRGAGYEYGIPDENGNTFYGRGFVQLTWKDNYIRASKILSLYDERDLEYFPHLALDSLIATRILFRGMGEGWFRGDDEGPHKLGRYFSDEVDDPYHARSIINADLGTMGKTIEGYHDLFLEALIEASPKEELIS